MKFQISWAHFTKTLKAQEGTVPLLAAFAAFYIRFLLCISNIVMNSKIYQFKLVLLGESSVGKSSLVARFVKGQFLEVPEPTIGGT